MTDLLLDLLNLNKVAFLFKKTNSSRVVKNTSGFVFSSWSDTAFLFYRNAEKKKEMFWQFLVFATCCQILDGQQNPIFQLSLFSKRIMSKFLLVPVPVVKWCFCTKSRVLPDFLVHCCLHLRALNQQLESTRAGQDEIIKFNQTHKKKVEPILINIGMNTAPE